MPDFRGPRIAKRVTRGLFILFVLFVNALLVWRIFFSTVIPKTVGTMLPNEALSAAYEQYGDSLTLRYQDQEQVTSAKQNYGYFGVVQCVFIPEARQVQIVVRYNNSTLKHLALDYGMTEIPSKDQHLFDVTLIKTTDLTPDVPNDDLTDTTTFSVTRYQPNEVYVRDTTQLYTYYRYVFDNVEMDELTVGVFADIYYVGDVDYNKPAYGTLCLYDNRSPWLIYEPSRADREALAQ